MGGGGGGRKIFHKKIQDQISPEKEYTGLGKFYCSFCIFCKWKDIRVAGEKNPGLKRSYIFIVELTEHLLFLVLGIAPKSRVKVCAQWRILKAPLAC